MFIVVKVRRVLAIFLCIAVGAALLVTAVAAFSGAGGTPVPVVMYHHVSRDPKLWGEYVISVKELESDLQWLRDNGYTTILPRGLIQRLDSGEALPEKPVILTFDDGQESFYEYVCPLLEKYGMCAVVSVIGIYIDRYTEIEDHHVAYSMLNWKQMEELAKLDYVEIGNHTYNMHNASVERVGCMSRKGESDSDYRAALEADIEAFQDKLEKVVGVRPVTFTYPYGFISGGSVDILGDMGFRVLLTCNARATKVGAGEDDGPILLGRTNRRHGIGSAAFFKKMLG